MQTQRHQVWIFKPVTQVVLTRAQRPLGYGGASSFDLILQRRELSLRKALIAYLGAASEFTGAYIDGSETVQSLRQQSRAGNYNSFITRSNDSTTRR